ncbi:MAG TPA: hypothetical protein VEY88_20080 [Archangium sp.]|nr:hypothetical protein [Archangium sp.]
MLSPELLLESLTEGRCLRSRIRLTGDERVLSRSTFPSLYTGGNDAKEAAFLKEIFRTIPATLRMPELSNDHRDGIRAFMAMVIRLGGMHKEDFVHRYIFEFWESLWPESEDPISMPERYYKGTPDGPQTPFSRTVLPKIRTIEAATDIIGVGGPSSRTLFLVEIKLAELDDRGLGQILRYYQLGRTACDRFYHDCDLRNVTPVLILKDAALHFWDAVPQYFREVLKVYYYRVTEDEHLHLVDGRRILQSLARDRIYS